MRLTDLEAGDQGRLFESVPDRSLAEAVWRWRQDEHPRAAPRPRGAVAWSADVAQGFVSVLRQPIQLGEARIDAAVLSLWKKSGDPEIDRALLDRAADRLEAEGVGAWLAIVETGDVTAFGDAGFEYLAEAAGRNLYIGLNAISSRLSHTALSPLRRMAQAARRIRTKLVEVALDPGLVEQLCGLMEAAQPPSLGFVKDAAYWRWRYLRDPRNNYRAFVHRSGAGKGIDAFAVLRRHDSHNNRAVFHLEEAWTRDHLRRDYAKLVGEVALLALIEEIDVLRCVSVAGSTIEQTLLGVSCIRKKVERVLMVRPLLDRVKLPGQLAIKDADLTAGDLDLY